MPTDAEAAAAAAAAPKDGDKDAKAHKDEVADPDAVPVEVEKPTKSLDEFLASIKKPEVGPLKAREAGEGENTSQWADFKPLVKHNEDVDQHGNSKKKSEKKTDAKTTVALDKIFKVTEGDSGRGGRGDSRGSRGGRGGNAGGRGGRSDAAPPTLSVDNFPALGGK